MMRKNILNFIITIVLGAVLSELLPWWSVMVAGFLSGLFVPLKKLAIFLIPFLAITLFWVVYAYSLGSSNDFILAKKIAVLFPLEGNVNLLLLITGIVGGIAAGVSAILGNQFGKLFRK